MEPSSLLIVVATAMEARAALSGLLTPEQMEEVIPAGDAGQCFNINGCVSRLLVSGVGPINAAFALGQALQRQAARLVLNLGLAGTYDKSTAPLGAVVQVTKEVCPEFGLPEKSGANGWGPAFADARRLGFPAYQSGEIAVWNSIDLQPDLLSVFLSDCMGKEMPGLLQGVAVSAGVVSADLDRAGALAGHYGALLENMEGFALALGCLHGRVPFVELRAISNIAGSRAKEDWDIALAFRNLNAVARRLFLLA